MGKKDLIMSNFQINLEEVTPIDQLQFEALDPNYKHAHTIGTALIYLLLAALALLLLLTGHLWLCLAAEALIVVAAAVNLALISKAYRFKGYAFRENDLTYRSGIIFPKVTTVPYVRIQQISINQNPITRLFHLYSLDIANGAQLYASLKIPGLSEAKANQIKAMLTEKITECND